MHTNDTNALADRVTDVPIDSLKPDVLKAIIEEFVTRDGTDYGEISVVLEEKVEAVLNQLKNGEAKIFYDNATECIDILSGNSMKQMMQQIQYGKYQTYSNIP